LDPSEGKLQQGRFVGSDLLDLVIVNFKQAQKSAVENHFAEFVRVVACKIKHLLPPLGQMRISERGVCDYFHPEVIEFVVGLESLVL
jgi:hypothetical protein